MASRLVRRDIARAFHIVPRCIKMKNEDITVVYLADGSSVHTRAFLGYFVGRNYDVHLITYTQSDISERKAKNLVPMNARFLKTPEGISMTN
jgi:hypothetical protein